MKAFPIVIDDGPGPLTMEFLDVLSEHGRTAMFGVIGSVCAGRELELRRMLEEGHTIVNHSSTHPAFAELTVGQVVRELVTAEEQIFAACGHRPVYVRSPYVRRDPHILQAFAALELEPILQSSVGDYLYESPDELALACRNHREFIGLHEIQVTLDALPAILRRPAAVAA